MTPILGLLARALEYDVVVGVPAFSFPTHPVSVVRASATLSVLLMLMLPSRCTAERRAGPALRPGEAFSEGLTAPSVVAAARGWG